MKKIKIFFLLPILFWGCRENNKAKEPEAVPVEAVAPPIQKVDPTLLELLKFADTDATKIDAAGEIFGFKAVDGSGQSTSLDFESGLALFKSFPDSKKVQNLPVMEIGGTNRAIIMVKGKGFGGPIWAMLLVDNKSGEILKLKFDHRAETEGYGAEIERASFQDQFIGKEINVANNTFGLQKHGTVIIQGEYPIDGISGATMTNKGVVDLMNMGLKRYATFLSQQ